MLAIHFPSGLETRVAFILENTPKVAGLYEDIWV